MNITRNSKESSILSINDIRAGEVFEAVYDGQTVILLSTDENPVELSDGTIHQEDEIFPVKLLSCHLVIE